MSAPAEATETLTHSYGEAQSTVPSHEQIAERAHQLWQDRGAVDGSPEEDWFRAEAELIRDGVE